MKKRISDFAIPEKASTLFKNSRKNVIRSFFIKFIIERNLQQRTEIDSLDLSEGVVGASNWIYEGV